MIRPFQYYQPQFSSLYGWQTRGNSSYNGLQLSLRHAMSAGLQFDFNYTYSKSIDVGSNAERVNGFESGLPPSTARSSMRSRQICGARSPTSTHSPDQCELHLDVPFGRGRHWGGGPTGSSMRYSAAGP